MLLHGQTGPLENGFLSPVRKLSGSERNMNMKGKGRIRSRGTVGCVIAMGACFFAILGLTISGAVRLGPESPEIKDVSPVWSPTGQRVAFVCYCWQKPEWSLSELNPFTWKMKPYYGPFKSPESAKLAEICTMDADGNNRVRLTDNRVEDSRPVWSPDGHYIAFMSRHNNGGIYVMDAEGDNLIKLTSGGEKPAWSPDGQYITFVAWDDVDSEIYIIEADGGHPIKLTDNQDQDTNPAWSPDGQHLAFCSDRDGDFEIYIMNADGSDQVKLTDNDTDDCNPAWSPNGQRIAFESWFDDDVEIYVVSIYERRLLKLTEGHSPVWSPDGSRIAFFSNRDGDIGLYVIKADGTEQTELISGEIDIDSPISWSPGGQKILFTRFEDVDEDGYSEEKVWVIRDDGSNPLRLSKP